MEGPYEQGNDPSNSVRGGEFPEQLRDQQLLSKESYIKLNMPRSFPSSLLQIRVNLSYDTT